MDQQPSSPRDLRERAVSSEPCSTRPNPFDEAEFSARKRRRTSLSGTSRSRSADSQAAAETGPPLEASMKPETRKPPPQTPEPQTEITEPPPTDTVPSKVTLNLRNAERSLEDSSTAPSPQFSPSAGTKSGQDEDIIASVEDREVDMLQPTSDTATSVASTSAAGSPQAVTASQDDDRPSLSQSTQARATIFHNLLITDPARTFPFDALADSYAEIMMKLGTHLSTHEEVAARLQPWIEDYVAYAKNVDSAVAYASYDNYKALWSALPDVLWLNTARKLPAIRERDTRQRLTDLYKAYAQLAAHFIDIECRALETIEASDSLPLPEMVSPFYATCLGLVTRRDPDEDDPSRPIDEISDVLEQFVQCHEGPAGAFTRLHNIAAVAMRLVPRFPRLLDIFSQTVTLALSLVCESERRLQLSTNAAAASMPSVSAVISEGCRFFDTMSSALKLVVEKHLAALAFETAGSFIFNLGELYQALLATNNGAAIALREQHSGSGGMLPAACVPDVLAMEWRLRLYAKLIMSSQMQVRVMAVTQMSQELVNCYKRFQDSALDNQEAVLQHVARGLLESDLIPYLLGPTCHPEITVESSNIMGFLVVTKTYTQTHTDRMWQTVTTTQDPRISDALLRMLGRTANLFSYEELLYFCTKLQAFPIEAFGPILRELCDLIFKYLVQKPPSNHPTLDHAPFQLCLRLLREASVPSSTSPVAHPDIQIFAVQRLRDLLTSPQGNENRRDLYNDCLQDIAAKSDTTMGSLHALHLMVRQSPGAELQWLTTEHDLTSLLVDELEHAIIAAREAGAIPVMHGVVNAPRRELFYSLILHRPSTLAGEIGERLWNMLVGDGAVCPEDRDASWILLNAVLKPEAHLENSYLVSCFKDFLPKLHALCFREGMLNFIRAVVLPLANTPDSELLDGGDDLEDSLGRRGMEQLWRVILTAPARTIELDAIRLLVNDVYIESRAVASSSHHRTRRIHLALVARCLRQLSSAATSLQPAEDGTHPGNGLASGDRADNEFEQQSLLFVRSLAILRDFLQLYRVKSNFAAPDLRSITLQSPGEVEGESAELKFQSFDGNNQTDIRTLNIGKQNTAASLLASLKEATGFDHYQLYYRGQAFIPHERDICKSLEDLQIHNGLILVKREPDAATSSVRIRPGASPVEIEILGHFDELWGYLTMEDKYAQEVYSILTTLPVYEQMAHVFRSAGVSHKEVFPLHHPFKSLYAVHALRDFVAAHRRLAGSLQLRSDLEAAKVAAKRYTEAVDTALSLIVAAVCDTEILDSCKNQDLRAFLSIALIESLMGFVKEPVQPSSLSTALDSALLARLLSIEMSALESPSTDPNLRLIQLTLQTICECCSASRTFWEYFKDDENIPQVVSRLLLHDRRAMVRKTTSKLLAERISYMLSPSAMTSLEFCEFLWPLVAGLIPSAIKTPDGCEECLALAFTMLKQLREAGSTVVDQHALLTESTDILLQYSTYEDITKPELVDTAAFGLVRIVHYLVGGREETPAIRLVLPKYTAPTLFWRHLFPPWLVKDTGMLPQIILNPHTRTMLIEIIFSLIGDDVSQLETLITDLDRLVPFTANDDDDEENPYGYELPHHFERSDAIRSSSGYVGLKNLSNTCYLNSLFTQLFMNTSFRRFMLEAEIVDEEGAQELLFNTRSLFGFLQNSIRRFIDPVKCVSSIKTYDDAHIDIHNQMDVDEFYNLLFDRWESQFLASGDKKAFRSFYGGQLVQQVRSQECRHISERLEPFSAIQCDIKGKTCLEQSLQAYVDGEIMEGDNKYKCSTCDRHVDAVKRACLKDIPDNLIFHLKRFDFNLRTLQRHKINDYFRFPNKIDMRPYTIDHLSSPSADSPPDMFELVGVLVHSGTAESGHYYSYIRERPSTKTNETWLEFNDDMVSPWDPAQMEASCYGGSDYRHSVEGTMAIDKPYSAYMLFYQRSSSIAAEQEALLISNKPSPLHVDMPRGLEEHIRQDNSSLLRRHCLYDPAHIRLVNSCLLRLKGLGGGKCSEGHDVEGQALQMALSHLDQVASRAKDIPDFQPLLGRIHGMLQTCNKCALGVYQYFNARHQALHELMQKHSEPLVRQETCNLLIRSFQEIKNHLPKQYGTPASSEIEMPSPSRVICGAMRMVEYLWDYFHLNLRSWHETFGFMLGFIGLGVHEAAIFMDNHGLKKIVMVICSDASLDVPVQFARMWREVQRRGAKPPAYDTIIALLHAMLSVLQLKQSVAGDGSHETQRTRLEEALEKGEPPLSMLRSEYMLLLKDWDRGGANILVEKLICLNQNEASTHAILARLLLIPRMDHKVFITLQRNISASAAMPMNAPFLRAALVYCRNTAISDNIHWLVNHIASQTRMLQNAEGRAFFRFHRDLASSSTMPRSNALTGRNLERIVLTFLPMWAPGLLGYYDATVRTDVEDFLQTVLFQHGTSPTFDEKEGGAERGEAMVICCKKLGFECLSHIEKVFVSRNSRVSEEGVRALQNTVHSCSEYFDFEKREEDPDVAHFVRLYQSTLDGLARLIREDDDEMSDQWNESDGSDMESIGSMNVDELDFAEAGRDVL